MKLTSLRIENFRGIDTVELTELDDMVMIAGPNGCGKSCVLDAIRLLKSTYGGYQPNEAQQWFGEFKINLDRNPKQLHSLLRSKSRPLIMDCKIKLSEQETAYLKDNGRDLVEELVWKSIAPNVHYRASLTSELRAHKPIVDQRVKGAMPTFWASLLEGEQRAFIQVDPSGKFKAPSNTVLEVVFGSYKPGKLGLLDYHSAHRNYARENFGGINLNIQASKETLKQHALYNSGNKYTNIKSELAAAYVRGLIADNAEGSDEEQYEPLTETLKELFATFFPGKEFVGPVPTKEGGLDFPVRLPNGLTHDINELSSGEKEVLFGYLRLRNTAPRDSVVLLDEPELHQNPALVRGLPQFYHRHLGRALGNQIWLVTHSDAFLREAMGKPGFSVFHMQDAATYDEPGNQTRSITVERELESAVIDLVGDLAAYRPGATVVIFEGEDSGFDKSMVGHLFPEFEREANLISAGSRTRVRRLHELLDAAAQEGGLPARFYSIVDRDTDSSTAADTGRQLKWDRYHIENYLLEDEFILRVLRRSNVKRNKVRLKDVTSVAQSLKGAAELTLDSLVCHQLQELVNGYLLQAIGLGVSRITKDVAGEFERALQSAVTKLDRFRSDELSANSVARQEAKIRRKLNACLVDGSWRKHFRGRDILKRFSEKHLDGMRYEFFRDLIIAEMRDDGFQPPGMQAVLSNVRNRN